MKVWVNFHPRGLAKVNTLGGIPSGPCALQLFSCLSLSFTAIGVITMSVKYIFFDLVPSSTSGTLFVSSRVKTLEKNAFKTSALSISSFTNTPSPLSKGLIPVVA